MSRSIPLTALRPSPLPSNQQDHTPQLPPQILLLDIVRVLDLAPAPRLPRHLQAHGLRRLFHPKLLLGLAGRRSRSRSLGVGAFLAPLHDQARRGQQALARQRAPLQRGQLKGGEREDPALHHLARAGGLVAREDGGLVEHGHDGDARPDARLQVGHGRGVGLFLPLAERGAVERRVVVAWVGRRGEAEEGVGVEVAEEGGGDRGADGG